MSRIAAHFILYLRNQQQSSRFYKNVLNLTPTLAVPGMTEFQLGDGCVLGLMPELGIKRLLGDAIIDPAKAGGAPRAELYLRAAVLERRLQTRQTFNIPNLARDIQEYEAFVSEPATPH